MEKLSLGEFLTVLRKGKGLKQEDVAEKLGVSAKTISSWENNRTYPDITMLPIIADLFDVTVDELVRGKKNSEIVNKEADEVLSNKSLTKIRKAKYSKYKDNSVLFTVIAFLSSLVTILGSFLMFHVALWTIIFAILGFSSLVTMLILLVLGEHGYLHNEGIMTREDYIESNFSKIIYCKISVLKSMILSFAPLFVYGFIDIKNPMGIACLILGGAGLVTLLILYFIFSHKYGYGDGKEKYRKNKKLTILLASIYFGIMGLSVLGFVIAGAFGLTVKKDENSEFISTTYEGFVNELNTYVVKQDNLVAAGLQKGSEYVFDVSNLQINETYQVVDLNNGFMFVSTINIKNYVSLFRKDENGLLQIVNSDIGSILEESYFKGENNFTLAGYDTLISIPSNLFSISYDKQFSYSYLDFNVGSFVTNDDFVICVKENYGSVGKDYRGIYYRVNSTDLIEQWIKCDNGDFFWVELDTGQSGEHRFTSVPILSEKYKKYFLSSSERDTETFEILKISIGYIYEGPDKGKFGFYYCKEINFIDLMPTVEYILSGSLLAVELIIGLIFWKREKYQISFKNAEIN